MSYKTHDMFRSRGSRLMLSHWVDRLIVNEEGPSRGAHGNDKNFYAGVLYIVGGMVTALSLLFLLLNPIVGLLISGYITANYIDTMRIFHSARKQYYREWELWEPIGDAYCKHSNRRAYRSGYYHVDKYSHDKGTYKQVNDILNSLLANEHLDTKSVQGSIDELFTQAEIYQTQNEVISQIEKLRYREDSQLYADYQKFIEERDKTQEHYTKIMGTLIDLYNAQESLEKLRVYEEKKAALVAKTSLFPSSQEPVHTERLTKQIEAAHELQNIKSQVTRELSV